ERETTPSSIEIHARLVTTPAELAGRQVTIPRTSPYRARLLELNDELTQDVEIVEVDDSSDRLIQKTAEGAIGYTGAAENLDALAVRRLVPRVRGNPGLGLAPRRRAGVPGVEVQPERALVGGGGRRDADHAEDGPPAPRQPARSPAEHRRRLPLSLGARRRLE